MNFAMKAIFFAMALNVAAAIMSLAIPIFNTTGLVNTMTGNGSTFLLSNSTDLNSFTSEIQPGGPASSSSGFTGYLYRIMDFLQIGFIWRFLAAIGNVLYGFPMLLESVLGGFLTSELRTFLFGPPGYFVGAIYSVYHLGYLMFIFQWWTGRRVIE